MRDLFLLMLLSLMAVPPRAAAQPAIDLKDGGTLVIRNDGNMVHRDAAGLRMRMRDGEPMVAKDGAKYVMKNDANWRTLIQKGSLNPKL